MKPGEIWLVDFTGEGSEADGRRPAVVVDALRAPTLRTRLVVPCSSKVERATQPAAWMLPATQTGLDSDSVALCHLCTAASVERFDSRGALGSLSPRLLTEVRVVLADALGIDAETFL